MDEPQSIPGGSKIITVEPDDTPDVLLPLVVLTIFIIFIGWILYLLISSGFQSSSMATPVSSDEQTYDMLCPVGQCATNIMSGFKRCPEANVAINVDPRQEVCNDRYLCTSTITPYALQSDGSTNFYGVCEPNVICPCLRVNQCPEYVISMFTANDGNPYNPLTGQRISFPQVTGTAPLQYTIGKTFCLAPLAWLPLSSPGCNFVSSAHGNSMTYNDLLDCMGMINGCNNIGPASPCAQGILALVTDDPDSITKINISNAQYGCVQGTPCPCNQIAIYDTNYGGIICRSLETPADQL
jgi:hypothetical protein